MPHEWMDVSHFSFNTLLLLEQVQLSWPPGWLPETELRIALKANPVAEWFLRHKCPPLNEWLGDLMVAPQAVSDCSPSEIRQAEAAVLSSMTDLIVYAVDPSVYDAQPFLNWDSSELLSLADFTGKNVMDVGAGTGRLTLVIAETARCVFAVEPVTNLRSYLRQKAQARNLDNVFPVLGFLRGFFLSLRRVPPINSYSGESSPYIPLIFARARLVFSQAARKECKMEEEANLCIFKLSSPRSSSLLVS